MKPKTYKVRAKLGGSVLYARQNDGTSTTPLVGWMSVDGKMRSFSPVELEDLIPIVQTAFILGEQFRPQDRIIINGTTEAVWDGHKFTIL